MDSEVHEDCIQLTDSCDVRFGDVNNFDSDGLRNQETEASFTSTEKETQSPPNYRSKIIGFLSGALRFKQIKVSVDSNKFKLSNPPVTDFSLQGCCHK